MTPSRMVRGVGRSMQGLVPRANGGLVVLAYHLVGAGTSSPVDVDEAVFRDQMELLAESERVVSLKDALRDLQGDRLSERSAYVLTFDDAYANFAEVVFPILQEYALPATLYVPIDFVSGSGPAPIEGTASLAACSWSELRELAQSGSVEIGSHTLSHRTLTRVSPTEAIAEIRDSRIRLQQEVAQSVTSFCYPRGAWNRELEHVVSKHYESSATGGGRRLYEAGAGCRRMPRYPIRNDSPADLGPIRRRSCWLEEALADRLRAFRS